MSECLRCIRGGKKEEKNYLQLQMVGFEIIFKNYVQLANGFFFKKSFHKKAPKVSCNFKKALYFVFLLMLSLTRGPNSPKKSMQ